MSAYLWKSYFENDLERFRQLLANATFNAAPPAKGGHGGKARHSGAVASPVSNLATSPTWQSKSKTSLGSATLGNSAGTTTTRTTVALNLTRADLNWKDADGITLLHHIASSNDAEIASNFGIALLEAPPLDLYIQDAESGWTALHRALYMGNINLARALINRDVQDRVTPGSASSTHVISGLIKVKDREGNSPFDVYGLSIANRIIRQASTVPLLSASSEDDENEAAHGVSGDDGEAPDGKEISPRVNVDGDEIFTFGSNKNFTLGFGDEDDRKNPERIVLKRPDHLLQRFHRENLSRQIIDIQPLSARLPALIQHRPIKIQDIQLSKFHSAVLTTDPEANLHVCGFGPGGRLGTGDETTRFQFVCIYGGGLMGKKIVHVALGQNHTIALSSQSEVFTWGCNSFGQLGYSSPTSQLPEEEPVQLLPRQIFGSIKREAIIGAAASRAHSVLHTLTSLYTFGKNDGQLGLVDSDARSLVQQITPRKVAASLFTSAIKTVSAIERATVCLLENHEVWVFANYGYTKVSFQSESLGHFLVKKAYSARRHHKSENHICKITSGGDTICALSMMGDVFAVHVSQKLQPDAALTSSTTNPPKIRGALSTPQKVWALRKDHMAVRDVAVGQDSSIIICTEAGSVWRRVERVKVKGAKSPGSLGYKPKDYKFSRVGGLTKVNAVRSNAFGAFAAVRKDCDVLKTQIEVESKQLWKDLHPLLPFRNLVPEDENSDTEEPAPRFWVPGIPASDTAAIRRAVLTAPDLEERLATVLKAEQASQRLAYDLSIKSTTSDVIFPVHEVILGGRSEVMRRGLGITRQNYYFGVPEFMTIEYDSRGKMLISFHGVDYITILNLVLYMYTDVVVDVWRHARGSPQLASRYRQIRLELMRLASQLHMPSLEQAVRMMAEPSKTMDQDLKRAIRNSDYFNSADLEIELDGPSIKVHSALLCRRCPFFEGLFNGRASGLWLAPRREQAQTSQEALKVDLKHVNPSIFRLVVQYLYADTDEGLFDSVVTNDFDSFLDVIMDVMSVANELMLDRLQQCCQALLGRFVNIRNVCQLLNTVAPCSLTDFKDAALEYICLNLEGMMENHLLDELDDDLMHELDQVVRQNQLACLPYGKSRKAEEELFSTYPELSALIKKNRLAKLELMAVHSRPLDGDMHPDGSLRSGDVTGNKSGSVVSISKSQQSSLIQEQKNPAKSPLLDTNTLARNLMFEMDEGLAPIDELDRAKSAALFDWVEDPSGIERGGPAVKMPESNGGPVVVPGSNASLGEQFTPVISESGLLVGGQYHSSDVDGELNARHLSSSSDKMPWNYPTASCKSDMKVIMAQASLNRSSNISSSFSSPPAQTAAASGSPARLSQRERKKRQQQQQQQQQRQTLSLQQSVLDNNSSPVLSPISPVETTPISPWQMISSPATKVSLEEVLRADSKSVLPSNRRKSSRASSNPPLTLRQTVSGNSPSAQKIFGAAQDGLQDSLPTRPTNFLPSTNSQDSSIRNYQSSSSISTAPRPRPRPPPSSSSLPPPAPASSSIQSIRHQPPAVERSLQLSMADILALQQTEKDIIKEAVAKRSLQDIQEEQAFQEWWDQESRKVMEKEEKAGQQQRGDVGRGGSGRGKARDEEKDGNGNGNGKGRVGSGSGSGSRRGGGGGKRSEGRGRGSRDGRGGGGGGGGGSGGGGGGNGGVLSESRDGRASSSPSSNGGRGSRSRGRGRGRGQARGRRGIDPSDAR